MGKIIETSEAGCPKASHFFFRRLTLKGGLRFGVGMTHAHTYIYIYILYVWMAGVREDVRVKMKIDLLMWFCAGFCEYL